MAIDIYDAYKHKNIPAMLREAGYHHEVHHRTGQPSFVRSFGGGFPRFHIYIEETERGWRIDLHLDQKAPSYGGARAHNGEYEGEVVAEEMKRLAGFVK